jgi:hypothetical protein
MFDEDQAQRQPARAAVLRRTGLREGGVDLVKKILKALEKRARGEMRSKVESPFLACLEANRFARLQRPRIQTRSCRSGVAILESNALSVGGSLRCQESSRQKLGDAQCKLLKIGYRELFKAAVSENYHFIFRAKCRESSASAQRRLVAGGWRSNAAVVDAPQWLR